MNLKELYEAKAKLDKAEKEYKALRAKFLEDVPDDTDTNYEYHDGDVVVKVSKVEYEPDIDTEKLFEEYNDIWGRISKVQVVLDKEKIEALEYDPAVIEAIQNCLIPKEPGRMVKVMKVKE